MGKGGKTVVVFLELVVGGLESRYLLCEALVMGMSFKKEFLKEGEVRPKLELGRGEFF